MISPKLSLVLSCVVAFAAPRTMAALPSIPAEAVKPAAAPAAEFFSLDQVRLGAGDFRRAMELDRAYLLRLEPDRLLHSFRLNVGLPSTVSPYGGWEKPDAELRGHTLGHYLSACALMYRSTGDETLRQRINYIVAELARCQGRAEAAGFNHGYLSAFPESFIDRVETLKPVWAPWYTLHKIMAGLFDSYELAGNSQALEVLNAMAGWVKLRVDRLTPEQMQASLQNEFGGMNEVLANLYAVTANPEHLKLARAFEHRAVFGPLAEGRDALNGLHANTQIPKIIGAARVYELTGDATDRKIAETFWEHVALKRSYVTGGHGDREFFFPVEHFAQHLGAETTETCNTYNMLKLSRHLWSWQPDAKWMDFYERGLYNHILASQDPALGSFVYLLSLEPGHFKTYSTPEHSFWCCVGTGMENHAKYADTVFARDHEGLYVNLFIPAELNWSERGVGLRQETRFPEVETTTLVWSLREPTEMSLRIRHPAWAQGALEVKINGAVENVPSQPGTYAEIKRRWRDGDRVEVHFPFRLRTEPLPGSADMVALLYGPVVLAARLGTEDMPSPYAPNQLDLARLPHAAVPALVTAEANWFSRVERVSPDALLFRTRGLAQPQDVLLAPLHAVHHERYTVYWRVLTPERWQQENAAVLATEQRWKSLSAVALDQVLPGDPASEASHAAKLEKSRAGAVSGRSWRCAEQGGYFSYTLEFDAGKAAGPVSLVCSYGSRDKARKFEVLLDDQKLAAPVLEGNAAGDTTLQTYEVPPTLLAGKKTLTVKFLSGSKWDDATANVFGVALVPKASL
jgi:uncharacterized protein